MKQKIIVKVTMKNDKSRPKALKTVVVLSGVESAALIGEDKDQIQIIGEGIDSVELTRQLRKKVGYSVLVSVGEDKKEVPKIIEPPAKVVAPTPQEPVIGWCPPPPVYHYPSHYVEVGDNYPQKIIVKVTMNNDKSRPKALKTVVVLSGVESVHYKICM